MKQHNDTIGRAKPPRELIGEMADPAEAALFKASARTAADRTRFGEHMLRRDPDRIGPYLMLADTAPTQFVRTAYLAQAVSVGYHVWRPWLKGDGAIAWWTDEATRPFMTALAMYGVEMAHKGTTWMAKRCPGLLLELDPADNIGAVGLFAETGLIHPGAGPPEPGRMT